MTRELTPITKTIVEKSIVDQIFELPLESVVHVQGIHSNGSVMTSTVIHRTGVDGFLFTRRFGLQQKVYVNREDVRDFFNSHKVESVTVLVEGGF